MKNPGTMNQVFHEVMKKGNVVTRLPVMEGDVYEGSKKQMLPREEIRQFLEPLGTFAMASIDDLDKAIKIIDSGLPHNGRIWNVAGGYIRDTGAVFCLLPEERPEAGFYQRLGLDVVLPSKNDMFKVGKYIKRLWSHHRKYVQGDVIKDFDNGVIMVRLTSGKVITVRYVKPSDDMKPLTEGMNLISTRCLRMLGFNKHNGTGIRVTALSPLGFTKGHAIARDNLKIDLVLYENKELLKSSNGTFTFALDELHPGNLCTDVQSVVNFQLEPYIEKWAEKYMGQVIDTLGDEEKLRRLLGFYKPEFHKWDHDDPEDGARIGEYIFKEEDWAILRAMRAGVSVINTPYLLRSAKYLFFHNIMNCQDNVRIPIQPEVGGARYILVDPTIFDERGDPTLKGVLKGNEVYCPGHTGDVVFHRQPNAHRGEHHIATSVHHAEHKAIDTDCFMFISRDAVGPVLKKLGGGDQDDRVVYYTDRTIVDHFAALPSYPVVAMEEQPKPNPNRYDVRLMKPRYDLHGLKIMMAQLQEQRVSIGQAVNPIMVDTHICDHADEIIADLNKRPKTPQVEEAITWMMELKKKPYLMSPVASSLEIIIDGVKRDGADVRAFADIIEAYWAQLKVVPKCFTTGGDFDGRLPDSRRDENAPLTVHTQLDHEIEKINVCRAEFEEHITKLEWERVRDIPLEITTYPGTGEADVDLAKDIRAFYHVERERLMLPNMKDKERKDAFIGVGKNVYTRYKSHPRLMEGVIELFILTYSKRRLEAPIDKDGKPTSYPDGIMTALDRYGLVTKMLDHVGLTTRQVEADIYTDCKRYGRGEYDVLIGEGIITVDTDQVGMIDPLADGQTRMVNKLVEVPATGLIKPYVKPTYDVLVVVDGHQAKGRTHEQIRQWKETGLYEPVRLIPYLFKGEHAVRVVIDRELYSELYGHIGKRDGQYLSIREVTAGWIAPADPREDVVKVLVSKS